MIMTKKWLLFYLLIFFLLTVFAFSGCSSKSENKTIATPTAKETPLQVAKKMFYFLSKERWDKACQYTSLQFNSDLIKTASNSSNVIPVNCTQAFQSLDKELKRNSNNKKKLADSFKGITFSSQEIDGPTATVLATKPGELQKQPLQLILLFNQWKVDQ
jgi:hypothetical protein